LRCEVGRFGIEYVGEGVMNLGDRELGIGEDKGTRGSINDFGGKTLSSETLAANLFVSTFITLTPPSLIIKFEAMSKRRPYLENSRKVLAIWRSLKQFRALNFVHRAKNPVHYMLFVRCTCSN